MTDGQGEDSFPSVVFFVSLYFITGALIFTVATLMFMFWLVGWI